MFINFCFRSLSKTAREKLSANDWERRALHRGRWNPNVTWAESPPNS